MNIKLLNEIKGIIENKEYPSNYKLFAGAGLIVSKNQIMYDTSGKIVVITVFAHEISWLIYKLKIVYREEIDYLNKYDFYPYLGKAALKSISENTNIIDVLEDIVIASEEWYKNYL